MIAGAATIGAEIIEDLPEVEAVLIPIGGGGLASGIAQAVRRSGRAAGSSRSRPTPRCRSRPRSRPARRSPSSAIPSFVDGMGSTRLLDAMWPLLERLIDEVVIVSLAEVEEAIRRLAADHHVIAEGAGAAALAAAGKAGFGKAVAIVSGGNIDWPELLRHPRRSRLNAVARGGRSFGLEKPRAS